MILVAEGRKSNYFFGVITTSIYLFLAIGNGFYGEVLTNAYFVVMQPIGLYVWLMADRASRTNPSSRRYLLMSKSRRMSLVDWIIA